MLTSLSSNAILAKAKTMFGRRLKPQDYASLIHCNTVTEVAVYLKKQTVYAKSLTTLSETEVHRGLLEACLKTKLLHDYASLCRYELSVGERFSDYLIRRGEIEQILHCLRLLGAGKVQEYLFTLPVFFVSHTDLDLFALARVKTFQEFLEALGQSKYRAIIERCIPNEDTPFDFTLIENALFIFLFSGVFDTINQYANGEMKEKLLAFFGQQVDFLNMLRIDRLKRFYDAPPDTIRSMIIPFHYKIKPKILSAIINAPSADEALEIFKSMAYRKTLKKYSHEYLDDIFAHSLYDLAEKNMYFSTFPSVVMVSTIYLAETEIENIIKIIEGIRYGLPKKEIAGMIIGYQNHTERE